MLYLESLKFPTKDDEFDFFVKENETKMTCYNTFYPFQVLSAKNFFRIDFEPITILYGNNGSGKTTALNVIAEVVKAKRGAPYNRSNFFEMYVDLCKSKMNLMQPEEIRVITSDDVFDYILDMRMLNDGIDNRRTGVFQEYLDNKYSKFKFESLADYEKLKSVTLSRRKTMSKYTKSELAPNIREYSNGENALLFFMENVKENGLYLLDEPENSLSVERQIELVTFLENAVRFFKCQLVIATHSPFILSMRNAKIYDLDADPVDVKHWTKLKNVKTYYEFFKKHEDDF